MADKQAKSKLAVVAIVISTAALIVSIWTHLDNRQGIAKQELQDLQIQVAQKRAECLVAINEAKVSLIVMISNAQAMVKSAASDSRTSQAGQLLVELTRTLDHAQENEKSLIDIFSPNDDSHERLLIKLLALEGLLGVAQENSANVRELRASVQKMTADAANPPDS